MRYPLSTAVALSLAAGCTFAQEEEDPLGWSGEGQFGLVAARGNTDADTLNIGVGAQYNTPLWRYKMGLAALRSEENGETNAERFELFGQADRKLTEISYVFVKARYLDDSFGSFATQTTLGGGYGRELINTEAHKLNGEVGLGYRISEPCILAAENGECLAEGDSDGEAVVIGSLGYTWQISDNTSFTDKLSVEVGSDNTFAVNDAALNVKMNDSLALQLGWSVRHNTDVSPGTKNTDTLTTMSLVYGF